MVLGYPRNIAYFKGVFRSHDFSPGFLWKSSWTQRLIPWSFLSWSNRGSKIRIFFIAFLKSTQNTIDALYPSSWSFWDNPSDGRSQSFFVTKIAKVEHLYPWSFLWGTPTPILWKYSLSFQPTFGVCILVGNGLAPGSDSASSWSFWSIPGYPKIDICRALIFRKLATSGYQNLKVGKIPAKNWVLINKT